MFSYFPTTKPNESLLNSSEEIYMLTPGRWDPHNDAYAYNEEHMLDWEGNMVSRKDRTSTTILLKDIDDADTMVASVSSAKTLRTDSVIAAVGSGDPDPVRPKWKTIPRKSDQISSILACVSPTLNDQTLYK
jgi:hypothetical protein